MVNAAHELAEILRKLRDEAPAAPAAIVDTVATDYSLTPDELLVYMASLAHRADEMFQELDLAGVPVEHLRAARRAWLKAPFLSSVGWARNVNIDADSIILPHDLALLDAFALQFESTSRIPKPNSAALSSFVLELEPIADFVESLDITDETKGLILRKIANVKMLLAEDGISFDVILTKLGEILGLLVILSGSNVLSDEDATKLWDKLKHFTTKFGQNMTVNVLSAAVVSGGMGALGM